MRVVRGASVWIDLNGHTITSPADNARAIFLQGSLRICDSSYDATKENKAEQFQGGIIMARSVNYGMAYVSGADKKDGAVGELRIFGGKYSATADTSKLTASMIGAIGKVYIFDGYYEAAPMNGNGALIVLQGATHADGYLAIRKATLVGAEAKNGGLISATDEGTLVAIRSGNLIGAEVSGRGGAIYMTNGELEIYGGTISGGTAMAEGGNIYTSNLKMTGGTVADGVSASYGGNIYLTGNSEISGGQIKDGLSTSTSRSGGNICVANKSTLIIKGNAEIFGGKANEGGNISVRDGSTVNIEGGKIYNGEAVKHGGNIVAFTTLNISGGEIYGGKAVDRGGNISTYGNYGKITITGGHIYNGILAGEYEKTVNGKLTIYNPEANARYGANISMLSKEDKPLELTILGGEIGGLGEGSLDVSSVHIQSSGDEITTTVGGTAVIDSLRMGTGRMLTIHEDGFAEGASIGIERFEIAGLFAPDASDDVAQYFHATEDGIEVRADQTGLILFALKPYWAFDVNNKQVAGAVTIAEAMKFEGASFVRLVQDAITEEVITGDLYLDLYGHDLTGLTVVDGKANIVDYATNQYADDVAGNLINFTGDVQKLYKADGEKFSVTTTYLALQAEDGSWSFHCVALSISHISLDAKNDALGFKATVKGDSAVQAAVTGFGFNMGVEGGTMRPFTKEGYYGDDGMFTLRLKGIMAADGGEMPIIGEAFILFGDDALTSSQKTTSMKEAIEAVNAAWDSYTDEQKAAVKAFVEANIAKMEGWAITNIQAWAPATEEPTPAE